MHRTVFVFVPGAILIAVYLSAVQEPASVLAPHEERQRVAEEHFQTALFFLERDQSAPAIDLLQYSIALDPTHVEAHRELAQLYYSRGGAPKDRASADDYFSRLLELRPADVSALTYRSTLRNAMGRFAAGESDARAGLELNPESDVLAMLLGNSLLRQHRFEEATEIYRRLAEADPARLWARWCLAIATERSGKDPKSLPRGLRIDFPPPDAGPPPARFTNVSHSLGVDAASRGRAVGWADFDSDGHYDIFAVGIRDPHVHYRNNGDGTFTDVTAASGLGDPRGGWAALTADFDNDGDPDIYVTRDGWAGREVNSFYVNEGGRFFDRAAERGVIATGDSVTASAADYDGDGLLDLYVANGISMRQGFPNALFRNTGNGHFDDVASVARVNNPGSSSGTAWGDYDGDGDPDLYVATYGGDNALYRNRGDGTFEDVTIAAGAVGPRYSFMTFFFDYDNDAKLDLFIAAWTQDFSEVIEAAAEGRVVDEERRLSLLRNEGDGTFTDVTREAGLARNTGAMSAGYFDFDNDGYLDILVGNGGPTMDRYEPDSVFHNQGDGTFLEVSQSTGLANLGKTHGVAGHDFDGDGDVDIYAGVGGQEIGDRQANALYRNEGSTNHWLSIRLVGTRSNRDAVGAKVTVWTGDRLRFQELAVGTGFGSTNSPPLEFGLGGHLEADRIEIDWPAGGRQVLRQVPADGHIVVTEGREGYESGS